MLTAATYMGCCRAGTSGIRRSPDRTSVFRVRDSWYRGRSVLFTIVLGVLLEIFKDAISIAKTDPERNLAFGWASVAVDKAGQVVVDGEGDTITPHDLEDAAYEFVLKFGEANVNHDGPVVGRLVESMVFTPDKLEKLGLPVGSLPVAWWTGWRLDDATFAKVKDGTYTMFSIEGAAKRVAV